MGYPVGSFIQKIICPNCNKFMMANVPATPPGGWLDSNNKTIQKCPNCGSEIVVERQATGDWWIRLKDSDWD